MGVPLKKVLAPERRARRSRSQAHDWRSSRSGIFARRTRWPRRSWPQCLA